MRNKFLIILALLSILPLKMQADAIAADDSAADTIAPPAPSVNYLPPPKGDYIWIPDSLAPYVKSVLEGKSKIVRDDSRPDISEKVIVRGDTVSLISRERNLGRYDRGLFNWLYVPKGTWQFGLTASYGEFSADDLSLGDFLGDLDFGIHSFSIKPYIGYFIKNNLSVGLRLGYTSMKGNIGSLQLDIMDDMNLDIHDVVYNNESYTAAIASRQYIGLGRNSRFGVFNEVELAFSSGYSDFTRNRDGVPMNTHSTYMDARITFSPGLTVFMMKNVAFNVSFGVFGFYLRNEKQSVDGVSSGNRLTSGANFKFNIFNINFGLGVFI